MKGYGSSVGEYFRYQHEHPPAPFNPDYDPKAAARYSKVTTSLESDNWYATHTREECKAEWGRRYDELKAKESGICSS